MINSIYVLYHTYENEFKEFEQKVLGFYSSKQQGEEAIKRFQLLDGFKDYPDDFFLEESHVNEDSESWIKGFSHKSWVEVEGVPVYVNKNNLEFEKTLLNLYQLKDIPKGPGTEYIKLKEWEDNNE